MRIYHLTTNQKKESLAGQIADRLLADEVGIMPTETVYGIMCAYDNRPGIQRIYRMKERDEAKQLQLLIGDLAVVDMLGISVSPRFSRLAEHFWPGPLTILVTDRQDSTIGLRMPRHPFVLNVINLLGKPLKATSANRSGLDPEVSLAANFRDLREQPDFIVKADINTGKPSTVVRLGAGDITIVREGGISRDDIHAVAN